MTYRPLPRNVAVRPSPIHGTGLIATEDIPANHEFGITHIKDSRFEDGYIRTPLGGFFNHSENPNCEAYTDEDFIRLRALCSIPCGEEITVKYWLYEVTNEEG
jgi:SET domain-containing protein